MKSKEKSIEDLREELEDTKARVSLQKEKNDIDRQMKELTSKPNPIINYFKSAGKGLAIIGKALKPVGSSIVQMGKNADANSKQTQPVQQPQQAQINDNTNNVLKVKSNSNFKDIDSELTRSAHYIN